MGIALRRTGAGVTQQLLNHIEASTPVHEVTRIGMTQVMKADITYPGPIADTNRASASSSAATQKPASIVFDSRHASTLRVAQSMIATK